MAGTVGIQTPLIIYFHQSTVGATADNYTVTRAGTVLDAWIVGRANEGGSSCTISNVGNAITDAMLADALTLCTRANTINDAFYTLAIGGILRVTVTDGGGGGVLVDACVLYLPAVSNATVLV